MAAPEIFQAWGNSSTKNRSGSTGHKMAKWNDGSEEWNDENVERRAEKIIIILNSVLPAKFLSPLRPCAVREKV